MKFSAIDIGSNAIRLLIADVEADSYPVRFKKHTLLRIPLRLGEDVFDSGVISNEKKEKLIWAMQSFHYLSKVHDVLAVRACATSAMREAKNGKKILDEIKHKVGLDVHLISGSKEAEIIHASGSQEWVSNPDLTYVYVDVGGGSTEISFIENRKIKASTSFPIGTVRMLKNKVSKKSWENMLSWLDELGDKNKRFEIIGSGGNINKIIKLVNEKRDDDEIPYAKLQKLYKDLEKLSFEDRMKKYDLNPDRADVIVPALKIFLYIMDILKAKKVLVPRIGLADGLIKIMYESYIKKYNQFHLL